MMENRLRAAAIIHEKLTGFRVILFGMILLISTLSAGSVFMAFYNRFSEAIEQTSLHNNVQVGMQAGANLETYLSDMRATALIVADELRNSDNNAEDINRAISLATDLRSDIEAIVALDAHGNPVYAGNKHTLKPGVNIYSQEWCDLRRLYQYGYDFSVPHMQNLYEGKYEWVISLVLLTSWEDSSGKIQYGSVLVDMNFHSFNEIVLKYSIGGEGFLYVTDRYGNIIYHPSQQMIYLGLKSESATSFIGVPDGGMLGWHNGRRSTYSAYTLPSSGWRVIGVSYLKSVLNFDANMQNDILRIFLLIIFLVLILASILSYIITQPIKRLTVLVQKMHGKGFNDSVDVTSFRLPNEVRKLAFAFNDMLGQIRSLVEQVVLEQNQLRKSEIKALQAQINPHFLYNTLDSIVWLAESGSTKEVTVMTIALADFFRLSISNGRDYITVEEELNYAKNYLIIQEMRYKDKFSYRIVAEDEALPLKVTKLLLQPLIENAIYHGIDKLLCKGEIIVRASRCRDRLLLEVIDDGCGMDRQTLEGILESDPDRKSGIGVKNVHQRIRLLFGPEYGLEFISELEEGTTAKVWLPIIE